MKKYNLVPVTIPKHQRKAIKQFVTKKNGIKISRISGSDMLRFNQNMRINRTQAAQIAEMLNAYGVVSSHILESTILNDADNFHFIMNEDNDTVIGAVKMKCKKYKNKKSAMVRKLVVHNKYRNQKVASSLLDTIEELAVKEQAVDMCTYIDAKNTIAEEVFKKHGYIKKMVFYNSKTSKYIGYWEKDLRKGK